MCKEREQGEKESKHICGGHGVPRMHVNLQVAQEKAP